MISLPIMPQIVTGAKSSTAAPLSIQRESWRATNPRVLDLNKWNGFLLLFFKLYALFLWLKILEYLYFEGRAKVVLKNVIFWSQNSRGNAAKPETGPLVLKRLYWLISRALMTLEIKLAILIRLCIFSVLVWTLFSRPSKIEGRNKWSFL